MRASSRPAAARRTAPQRARPPRRRRHRPRRAPLRAGRCPASPSSRAREPGARVRRRAPAARRARPGACGPAPRSANSRSSTALQLARIAVERRPSACSTARAGLAELGQRPREAVERRVERALGLRAPRLEPAQRLEQRALGALGPERLGGAGDVLADALGGAQPAAAGVERRLLVRLRVERVEFGRGVRQRSRGRAPPPSSAAAAASSARAASARAAQAARTGRAASAPAKASSSAAVAARVEQAAVVLLAVQLDQRVGERAQRLGRDAAVVDPGLPAAVGARRCGAGSARRRPGSPASASTAARRMVRGRGANAAVTSPCAAPARTSPPRPRQPSTKPRQSSRIDLPAPVSPVSTLRPGRKSQLRRLDQHHVADRRAPAASLAASGAQRHLPWTTWR